MDHPEGKYHQEAELIARARKGEDLAFVDLVSGYRIRLFRKAVSLLGNSDDAEDILQDTMISAYRALHSFRGESGIYTWLYRILVNKCRDFQRSRKNAGSESLEKYSPIIFDDRLNVEKKLELSEDAAYLIDKINSLDKKYRKILLMRYYDDLSYHEISEILGYSLGTVKSRLFKARELLKRALVQSGKGERYFEEDIP